MKLPVIDLSVVVQSAKTGKTGKGERMGGIKAFVPHDMHVSH